MTLGVPAQQPRVSYVHMYAAKVTTNVLDAPLVLKAQQYVEQRVRVKRTECGAACIERSTPPGFVLRFISTIIVQIV